MKILYYLPALLVEETSKYRVAPASVQCTGLGRVLVGLFRNRNTRNRRYLCSFGSYSVFGMNRISFRSFCSR